MLGPAVDSGRQLATAFAGHNGILCSLRPNPAEEPSGGPVFTRISVLGLCFALGGCGYSEDEWQAQLAKYDQLNNQYEQEKAAHAQTRALLDAEMKRVADLSAELKNMGVNLDSLSEQLQQTGTEKDQMAAS